jgi:hypothetical protein
MAKEQPLSAAERATLITTYLRHAAEQRDDDAWAFDAVNKVANSDEVEASWDLVVELVQRSPDEQLGYVAAGPLEDMVRRHGPAVIEWLEGEAQRDPRFQWALGCIWLQAGELPPGIEQRVVTASGGEITVLPGPSLERLLRPDT